MSKTLHALATSPMLALLFLLLSVGTVSAEQQPNLSSRADVDSQIISLLDKIEFTLVMKPRHSVRRGRADAGFSTKLDAECVRASPSSDARVSHAIEKARQRRPE